MRWRNEIRAFTSKLTHCSYNFPFLCMTRASSQLIYAAFYFLLKFKKELKNTTTLIFCMYILYGSCCLLVVVKGDVDCKAMFNVVCVYCMYHTNMKFSILLASNRFKLDEEHHQYCNISTYFWGTSSINGILRHNYANTFN